MQKSSIIKQTYVIINQRINMKWIKIPSHPRYSATENGQIRGPRGVMTITKTTRGAYVTIARDNSYIPTRVGRLIAEAFIGSVVDMEVHHKDRNPFNNHKDNLEILTTAEHRQLHEDDEDYHARGEGVNTAKLNAKEVLAIKIELKPYKYSKGYYPSIIDSLAMDYNVDTQIIKRIFTGNTWKHITT